VVADLYVFGGAAMALAYDSRRATRDVDALFKPHGIVVEEAQAVAAELDLPRWWLNEQASSYVAPGGDSAASRVFDHPGLRVFAASPEHLLAMKALAARPRDAEDIRHLVRVLGLHTADDVLASVREIFPRRGAARATRAPPKRHLRRSGWVSGSPRDWRRSRNDLCRHRLHGSLCRHSHIAR
jgi:predicted nucleotidyltransferase